MIELKELELKMVPTNNQVFRQGCYINDGTHIGYVTSIIEHEKIEVTYTIGKGIFSIDRGSEDMDDELEVVEPYLLSYDDITSGQTYYCRGSNSIKVAGKSGGYHCDIKVVAEPKEIGWIYLQEGPPHDRAYDYKNGAYVEVMHPLSLLGIIDSGGLVKVQVAEVCPHYNGAHLWKDCSCKSGFIHLPLLHEGKVILFPNKINYKSKEDFYLNT